MKISSILSAATTAMATTLLLARQASSLSSAAKNASRSLRVTVFGGTGYVGSAVCERLVRRGYEVTAVSRRGENPNPKNADLAKVNWVRGDATDPALVQEVLKDSDAAVHAIGLLFDVDSGLANLNKIVSGSGSVPGNESTYDAITRRTAFNVIDSIEKKMSLNLNLKLNNAINKGNGNGKELRFPLCFVSAAEVGWPEVTFGSTVDSLAPGWLQKYLAAKRSVEGRLKESKTSQLVRSVIYRPSLIWDWTKFDVLPAIPAFNIASAVGVPFVDKTVRVETLADAIVAGLENEKTEGVQRFMQMEELCKQVR